MIKLNDPYYNFSTEVTISHYKKDVVTAGIWLSEKFDDVLEATGATAEEATLNLYTEFLKLS